MPQIKIDGPVEKLEALLRMAERARAAFGPSLQEINLWERERGGGTIRIATSLTKLTATWEYGERPERLLARLVDKLTEISGKAEP
jgi:hypothetical protein